MFSCCIIISCGLKENNVTKTKQWGPRLSYGSAGKEFTCNVGDLGSIPGLGRSPGEGKVYPFQYSDLENFVVRGVARSQTLLSDFHTHKGFGKFPYYLKEF